MHNVVLLKLCLDNDQWASLDELNVNPRKDVMVGYRLQLLKARAVVKSTFVKSKTSPSPKWFESESRPSPKRFESKSSPSPNETVKTEKEKKYLLQNHILNYW